MNRVEAVNLLYRVLRPAAWVSAVTVATAGFFIAWAEMLDTYGLFIGTTLALFPLWGLVQMGVVAWRHRESVSEVWDR